MAPESRHQGPVVDPASAARALEERAKAFEFLQAVLLLERLAPERARVGRDAAPSAEVVRFTANPSLSFPTGDIHALELHDDAPARLSVNFMGLVGPSGVLPHAYTQLVREAERSGEHALGTFLDILQHRFIALFYRAWLRLHPAGFAGTGERDPASRHLLQLAGLDEGPDSAEGAERARPAYDPERLIPLFALLAPQPRSALGLRTVLASYFDVPVEVEQFVGSWARLRADDLCRVGDELGATVLGGGAVVGDEIWDQQARVRVRLGPLPREHFERFLPGGEHHAALRDLCALYGHAQFDFEVQLVLERDDVPTVVLGDADRGEHALGWSTWLRTRPMDRDPDEAVFSL